MATVTAGAYAQEAYCTKIGKGEFQPIHKVCNAGDIVEVNSGQVLTYCDFSRQIIAMPSQKDTFVCQFIGYNRKFRSRVDGKESEWIIEE
jgi:hypothetical protein